MSDKMAEIIKKASKLAENAPENLRDVAFQKAFDALMEESAETADPTPGARKRRKKTTGKKKAARTTSSESDTETASLDDLDRTAHPEIHHSETGLDNALMLIRAARDDLDIDGLSGSEIARTLSETFRIPITQQAVSAALNDASRYVNRHREGNKVLFRIMGPGEEYLDSPRSEKGSSAKKKTTKKASKRKARKAKAKKKKAKAKKRLSRKKSTRKKANKKSASKKTASRSFGSGDAIALVYEDGFLSQSRTIGAIVDYLRDQYGRSFKTNELSTPLVRYLRDGKLSRERNEENQYEYRRA